MDLFFSVSSLGYGFCCIFRNFAIEIAKLLRLGKKKKRISFILLSTFRNFARICRISLYKGNLENWGFLGLRFGDRSLTKGTKRPRSMAQFHVLQPLKVLPPEGRSVARNEVWRCNLLWNAFNEHPTLDLQPFSSPMSNAKVYIICKTTKLLRNFSLFLLLFRNFVLPLQLKAAKLLTLGNRCKHHCTRLIAVLHT